MTALTASGWLWAGWCVFLWLVALARTNAWIYDHNDEVDAPAREWFVALLSTAWLAWLVSP